MIRREEKKKKPRREPLSQINQAELRTRRQEHWHLGWFLDVRRVSRN